ncbi:biopolymer transporter ExbD [candidate division WOR-3 bacterium]|nr:biopolymer transporter ExbD [candidate division WOR-3 bacterium]
MKIRRLKGKEKRTSEAQVTSLVDIALSLVIFFIVTLPALLESGIFVKAPGVQNVGGSDPGDDVKVSIYIRAMPDGQTIYELNKEIVDIDELDGYVEALLARSADRIVMVRADGAVSHGDVVRVLDIARQKDANSLALLRGKPLEEE